MKKYIITLGLLATMMVPASAQDVLNEIVKMSQATVNDTTQNIVVRKTAVFKYDAMTYLRSKMLPASAVLSDNVDLKKFNEIIRTLNEQALAMNQLFVLLKPFFLEEGAPCGRVHRYAFAKLCVLACPHLPSGKPPPTCP